MPIYTCPECMKTYDRRSSYLSHTLKRKTPCVIKNDNNKIEYRISLTKKKLKSYFKTIDSLQCAECNKTYATRGNLRRHIFSYCGKTNPETFLPKKNIPVAVIEQNANLASAIPNNSAIYPNKNSQNCSNFMCNFCYSTFTRKDSLVKHLTSRCPIKNNEEKEDNDRYNKLLKEMKKLKEQNIKLQESIKTIAVNNTNTIVENLDDTNISPTRVDNRTDNRIDNRTNMVNSHITNNSNNNNAINSNNTYNIIAFGKEKLDYNEDVVKFLLSYGYDAVAKTIEYTNLNKNKPQYHNVYIPNIKSPYATVYDGKDWKLEDINIVLNQLYDDKRCYLEDKFDEFISSLDKTTKKKFKRFLNDDKDDSKTVKWIKKRIRLLLYNKRKVPMQTKDHNESCTELIK
jgi:hypothetical protein